MPDSDTHLAPESSRFRFFRAGKNAFENAINVVFGLLALAVVAAGVAVTIIGVEPARSLIKLQSMIFGGYFYPVLTGMLVMLTGLGPLVIVRLIVLKMYALIRGKKDKA
jgi:hypothetical protein